MLRFMRTIRYISTRGGSAPVGFVEAALTGQARDAGLLVPDHLPSISERLDDWVDLPYAELAVDVLRPFCDLPEDDLRCLVHAAYATFDHPEVTPIVRAGPMHVMELFHGPTLSFKDIALQFLGRLFSDCLQRSGGELNLLAATSGDTGSAAIHGVRGRPHLRIFTLYPHGRISPLQERQMTAVLDENVFPIAVEGTFDDCQRIVKSIFADLPVRERLSLGAVNSINWARIAAQMVYYVYAALRVRRLTGAAQVQFAVPTGNFGNILAGWYAARMGLPVSRLILATNENDILARFFNRGEYRPGQTVPTLSPSMDIQVASNFERYLFDRLGRDPNRVRAALLELEQTGALHMAEGTESDGPPILAGSAHRDETLATIRHYAGQHGVILDPHTAVAVAVAERLAAPDEPTICLATAHPAKFPEAIRRATGREPEGHEVLDCLADAPVRSYALPADAQAVRDFLMHHIPTRG